MFELFLDVKINVVRASCQIVANLYLYHFFLNCLIADSRSGQCAAFRLFRSYCICVYSIVSLLPSGGIQPVRITSFKVCTKKTNKHDKLFLRFKSKTTISMFWNIVSIHELSSSDGPGKSGSLQWVQGRIWLSARVSLATPGL